MRADLALVGFGNVARRFSRLIEERRDWLALDYELDCRIVGIATRRHGSMFQASGLDAPALAATLEGGGQLADDEARAADSLDIIGRLAQTDAPLKVLVETTTLDIGAGQPAIDHVRAALQAGCHAVTANKGPAAFAYEELSALAADRERSFLFEGAVMDGVPIFNLVRATLPAVEITGFRGVINSTTNHILSALEDGESFDAALQRMQALGIAEADPSLDIDGWDAAAKTAALANVLLGARVTPRDVERRGIAAGDAAKAIAARADGRRLKLVAQGRRTASGVVTRVWPEELTRDDLLAHMEGQQNALVLETDLLQEIAIVQRGGGLTQTAYALLSDLITVARATRQSPPTARRRRSRSRPARRTR